METILAADGAPVEATLPSILSWREAMKRAVRDGGRLCEMLGIPREPASELAHKQFPVFAPLEFISRMQFGDPNDPLLRQVLATGTEAEQLLDPTQISMVTAGASPTDPVGDLPSQRMPGLLQKYEGRALLLATGACAVHCRYCFRRHFPYDQLPTGRDSWMEVLEELRCDTSLNEIIFSGGDPLTLVDDQLQWLVEQVDCIPHVRRIRFHTRLPIVIPQRVNDELLQLLQGRRARTWVVLHCNHAQEIDEHVVSACRRLQQAGAILLNQAVLLNGINDTLEAQFQLCERLIDSQIVPYYLHQLDRVSGGMHFQVADTTARLIIEQLRTRLPGYAIPTLVREVAGQASKTPL